MKKRVILTVLVIICLLTLSACGCKLHGTFCIFLSFYMGKDGQAKVNGPARTTSGYDVSVFHDAFLYILGTLCGKGLFEAVITCHLLALKAWEKAENHAWSRADGRQCAAFRVVLLHDVHELAEGRKV